MWRIRVTLSQGLQAAGDVRAAVAEHLAFLAETAQARPVPAVRDLGFGALTLRVIGWDLLDDASISPADT